MFQFGEHRHCSKYRSRETRKAEDVGDVNLLLFGWCQMRMYVQKEDHLFCPCFVRVAQRSTVIKSPAVSYYQMNWHRFEIFLAFDFCLSYATCTRMESIHRPTPSQWFILSLGPHGLLLFLIGIPTAANPMTVRVPDGACLCRQGKQRKNVSYRCCSDGSCLEP